MRDVRRLVAPGSWLVQPVAGLVSLAVIGWPFLFRDGAGTLQRRQYTRATGWTPAERHETVRRAYAGELPTDPADRSRPARLVGGAERERRHFHWILLGAAVVFAAGPLLERNDFPGRSEWAVAAYELLVGSVLAVALRRKQGRRVALLARLDRAGVEGSRWGSETR